MDVIEFPNPIEVVEFLRMFGVIGAGLLLLIVVLTFLAYPPEIEF